MWFLVLCCATVLAAGCSDLLDTKRADAVVQIEADDQSQVLRTRQEVLASAPTWDGTRVGEETVEANETALEFTLPGANLETALGAIGQLDARVVTTTIDVDATQVDRGPTTTSTDGSSEDPSERQVRLRVEVTETGPAGAASVLRVIVVVFSIVGVVATFRWLAGWFAARRRRAAPQRRRIDRVDLREGPPTRETPQVPPQW